MILVQSRSVTFSPPEQAVYLMGDFTDWDERPLPINGPLTLEFPEGAYIEYAFLDAHMRPLADEANAQRPVHPWYTYHRCCFLPGNHFQTPPRALALQGTVSEHTFASQILEASRTYWVYEPPVSPVATFYVQDGEAFYRKLALHQVADALVVQGSIKPVRLVFIEPRDRVVDYWFNVNYERFLLEELLPQIEDTYGPTAHQGLWGASLGGMVSAWLAWRNSRVFSLVASQSGCFTAEPEGGNYYRDAEWLTEQFAQTERRPVRFYLDTGQIEWLLAPNRRFAAMLADKGYMHSYHERAGGHNWTTWEQGLASGLHSLLGSKNVNI